MPKYLLIFLFLVFDSFGQNKYDQAVLLPDFNSDNKFIKDINQRFYKYLKNEENIIVFDWNEAKHTIAPIDANKEIKRPINLVKYIDIQISNFSMKPPLELILDTAGRTKAVQFIVADAACGFVYETIEVKTSKIIEESGFSAFYSSSNSPASISPNRPIPVSKFLQEFGGDPNQIKNRDPGKYAELVEQLTEKYKATIEERYFQIISKSVTGVGPNLIRFKSELNKKSYIVARNPDDPDDSKQFVNFDGVLKDSLHLNEGLALYEVAKFGDRKLINFIADFTIAQVGEDKSIAKISPNGDRKKLAELLRGENELVLLRDKNFARDYNRGLNKNQLDFNVAVRKKCIFCSNGNIQSSVINLPMFNVMERNAKELVQFQELAKIDKFVDLNSEELLNKQLGIKYLLYPENENVMATDIETGKVYSATRNRRQALDLTIKSLFLNSFDKKIEFLQNQEVVKSKVKEVILYNDFGFKPREDINMYVLEEEQVGSKTLKRKVIIGVGSVSSVISEFICIMRVKDGEKELFDLQAKNKEVFFEYKLK